MQEKFTRHFWVPCIGATSTNLFLEILYINLRITRDTKNPLDDILHELNALAEPSLILVDNFDTPWNLTDGSQQAIRDIIRRLANIRHVALLVTMRGTHPPSEDIVWQPKYLPPTDASACRQIFRDIFPSSEDDSDLDNLLKALGHMPFAVTLMAKLGKETHSSAQRLLESWNKSGTNMISSPNTPEENMNRSINLSVESSLVKTDHHALTLLAALSMLPDGTTHDRLHWWIPAAACELSTVATLTKAALLMVSQNDLGERRSPTLFVLPVIQSFMHSSGRIPLEIRRHVHRACCKYVTQHACQRYDFEFKSRCAALRAEDSNLQAVLFPIGSETATLLGTDSGLPSSGQSDTRVPMEHFDALLAFVWYRNNTQPSADLASHILHLARSSGDEKRIGDALHCLGHTYHQLDRFEMADTCLRDAYTTLKTLSADQACLQSACECALTLSENFPFLSLVNKLPEMICIIESAREGFATLSDEYGVARCSVELGHIHRYTGDYSLALKHLDFGRRTMERLGRDWDVARSLYIIGHTYYLMRRNSDALDSILKAWKIAEAHGDEYLSGDITQITARIYTGLDKDDEALDFAKKSLLVHQRLGRPLGMAQNFEYIGYIYWRRNRVNPSPAEVLKNVMDAYAAFDAAATVFGSMTSLRLGTEGGERCRQNLAALDREKVFLSNLAPSDLVT